TVAPGAVLARLGEGAAVLADLVSGEVVDVGLAGVDQVDGPLVELMEVVGGVVEVLTPVEAEPADVLLDRVDVLLLFLDRVGVVEAQVTAPTELLGDREVECDRLRVADVEVSVRLGREAGHDLRDPALAHVGGDDLADEIASFGSGWSLGTHAAATHHSKRVVQYVAMSERASQRCRKFAGCTTLAALRAARLCSAVVPARNAAYPRSVQRKVVTALFCDVTGSTALGESLDPEALQAVLARYFDRM